MVVFVEGTCRRGAFSSLSPTDQSCRRSYYGKWRPAKVECHLFSPQLERVDIPPAERELFGAEREAWIAGGEFPDHHDYHGTFSNEAFYGDLIGYAHKCSWAYSVSNSEAKHILVFQSTVTVSDPRFGKFAESQTFPVVVDVSEPLFAPARITAYLGILSAVVAIALQLYGLRKPAKAKESDIDLRGL